MIIGLAGTGPLASALVEVLVEDFGYRDVQYLEQIEPVGDYVYSPVRSAVEADALRRLVDAKIWVAGAQPPTFAMSEYSFDRTLTVDGVDGMSRATMQSALHYILARSNF